MAGDGDPEDPRQRLYVSVHVSQDKDEVAAAAAAVWGPAMGRRAGTQAPLPALVREQQPQQQVRLPLLPTCIPCGGRQRAL